MNKEEQFLKEYEKLCQKYHIGFQGCGCCGSPCLEDIEFINYDKYFNKVFINGNGFWHKLEKEGRIENEVEKRCLKEEKTIEEYFRKKIEK